MWGDGHPSMDVIKVSSLRNGSNALPNVFSTVSPARQPLPRSRKLEAPAAAQMSRLTVSREYPKPRKNALRSISHGT